MNHQYQQQIWQTVLQIPCGKVASYGQIADLAGLPGRARLVGKALGVAPEALKVPWYRVLRSDGKIAFAAQSEQAKNQTALLQQENVAVFNNRVKLTLFQWQPDLADLLFKLNY
ncbi:MGMT family protein [Aliiglaciecola lipolytica]|uniref:Methylated-DNA-protein-cysteine methyltransferase related protein n=1 Tax=Aliiglaciecola lipolytica E3 TaxID=1127673 RepID=K6XX63_9ALTE|nr:MGMT family protein [Aliiglaciecola lipolytica]GAC16236.1 methylated-DNA-protein-cysteine methyltransferase related protein [Aliiglaciecola lipolytica E3]